MISKILRKCLLPKFGLAFYVPAFKLQQEASSTRFVGRSVGLSVGRSVGLSVGPSKKMSKKFYSLKMTFLSKS